MNLELMNGTLSNEQIKTAIETHDRKRYEDNLEYMNGNNPTIMHRQFTDVSAPHSNVPIPYGRKIIKTVTGYMYKPGLIQLACENQPYLDALKEIYWNNNEDTKTAQLGEQVSLHGVGYEVHYMAGRDPRFVRVPAAGMIPIWNNDLEPTLSACVRVINRVEDRTDVEVYYPDRVDYLHYDKKTSGGLFGRTDSIKLFLDRSEPHEYESVPVVVFQNNNEMLGDFEPAVHLIDAYDRLMSDSLNEFDRFAWAYLVLKGMGLSKDDAADIKQKRVLEIMTEFGDVKFLTKDVPSEFITFMAEWIRKEIHKQTHVPDFTDDAVATGGLSGVAMDRMLYDFEFIATTKEMYFRDGLYQRLKLLNVVMGKTGREVGDVKDVEILFSRNKVSSLIEQGDAMQRFAGHVTEKTLLEQFAPFVKDVDAEIEEVSAQKALNMATFGAGLMDEVTNGPDGSPASSE